MQFVTRQFPNTRLRRVRSHPWLRDLVAEQTLTTNDLIYPLFIMDNERDSPIIATFPGITRFTQRTLLPELEQILQLNIRAIALFPVISPNKKTPLAEEASSPEGLIPQTIRLIKKHFPSLGIISDVALDPYTIHGQDGLLNEAGEIMNDLTVEALVRQALTHAEAGADIIAPSDMMDGRISAIRQALEQAGFLKTSLLSYAAKYASKFYQPFREAVRSAACLGENRGKETYQMDSRNSNEALHEVALDLAEGADIVMVKPGIIYLDILQRVKETFRVPTFIYQVSGEYVMLKAAAQAGLEEKAIVLESLMAMKRAGADAILTYFAKPVAKWLQQD